MIKIAYPLVDEISFNGVSYALDLSFDNVLRLFEMFDDNRISNHVKIETALKMLIGDDLGDLSIEEKDKVLFEIIDNVVTGEDDEEIIEYDLAGNPMPVQHDEDEVVFDMIQDSEYIFSSFMYDYGINLIKEQGKLHWYEFKSLLNGLSEDSKLMRVIDIRTMDTPKKGKEREQVIKLKKHYALK